ncbi:MAG: amidase [Magnetospiraceae bacterium]
MKSLRRTAAELAAGTTTSQGLIEAALDRIKDPQGEGDRVFLNVYGDRALVEAKASDALRAAGYPLPPLAGIPLSVKDLYDVAGDVTRAGSTVLADAPPAMRDSTVVRRLRAAGAIIIGRTNMTEFAYSGVGLNSHYGTPKNPYDRASARIPGGSSSGAVISVTDGMAVVGIGSDTNGSTRIPAALCGTAGFRPTQGRIPLQGVFPLSESLDAAGPLAPTADCCAIIDAIMADQPPPPNDPFPLTGLRLLVPQCYVLEDLEPAVAHAFERSLTRLSEQGAWIIEAPAPVLDGIPALYHQGGIVAAEAWHLHRDRLAESGDRFDPLVRERLALGKEQDAAHYIHCLRGRAALQKQADALTLPYDAVLLPTTAMTAPPIADLQADEAVYRRVNLAMLRNTSVASILGRCAASVPCHGRDDAPSGITIMGETGGDAKCLRIAAAIEKALGWGNS